MDNFDCGDALNKYLKNHAWTNQAKRIGSAGMRSARPSDTDGVVKAGATLRLT